MLISSETLISGTMSPYCPAELAAHLADAEGQFLVCPKQAGGDLLAEQQFDLGRLQDRLDRVLFAVGLQLCRLLVLVALQLVGGCDLARDHPAEEGHAAAQHRKRQEGQARHQGQHDDEAGGDHQSARVTAELVDDGLVGGTGRAAARDEQACGERDDQGRDLGHQAVADRQLDEDVGGFADRHVVANVTDDDAAEDVDGGDQEAGDGIAAHELRRTVHRAVEGAFLFQLAAAALRLLLVDQAGREIGVDRHLLAGNGIEGEARADFGDTRRTLGDDDEVHGDQDQKDDQTDDEVAAHDQVGKAGDDATGRIMALMTVRKDDAGCRNVQRQPGHGGNQKDDRKGREIQRFLDPQRHHQDQHGKGDGEGQPDVDQKRRDRQKQDRQDRDDAEREADIPAFGRDFRDDQSRRLCHRKFRLFMRGGQHSYLLPILGSRPKAPNLREGGIDAGKKSKCAGQSGCPM